MYKKTAFVSSMVITLCLALITPVHSYYIDGVISDLEVLTGIVDAINQQAGITNCLDVKIETVVKVITDLNDNNDVAALKAIESFIRIVEIQSGKQLTEEQAESLIDAAKPIQDAIQSIANGVCPWCGSDICVPPCPGA